MSAATELLSDGFDRVLDTATAAVRGLGTDQLAQAPRPGANSVGWLVWHLTRVQDDHVATVAGSEQVWTSARWHQRFGLPFDVGATGYGQSSEEVAQLRVSGDLLVGYLEDVHAATLGYLGSLQDEDFARVVDERWDPPVTLGVRLVSVLDDDIQHAGQAAYARGLL